MKLRIDKLGMNGEGVARPLHDEDCNNINKELQKVTFVDFALPDELVEVEIINEKAKFCNARLKQVIESSLDRVNAPCPYFTRCGGSNLQH